MSYTDYQSFRNFEHWAIGSECKPTNSNVYLNNAMPKHYSTNFENNIMQLALIQQNDPNSSFNNVSMNYLRPNLSNRTITTNKTNGWCTSTVASTYAKKQICGFCKRNGESMAIFQSHTIKDSISGHVVCPILRKHVCELCGATGDEAHTRSHCPMAEIARTDPFLKTMIDKSAEHKMHNMVSLKKTRINSAGKLRRF